MDRIATTKMSFKSLTKVAASSEEFAWNTRHDANITSEADEEEEGRVPLLPPPPLPYPENVETGSNVTASAIKVSFCP